MKRLTTPEAIKNLGTIMGIWAHPDDESFLAAGLMALAVQNGQKVICVTATCGEAGESQNAQKWPQNRLGEVRARELLAALNIVGVQQHHWLNYHDGCCCDTPTEQAVKHIQKLVELYHPNTIITFPPDGITGHADHQAVSRWVNQVVHELTDQTVRVFHATTTTDQYDQYLRIMDEKINIYFNIEQPNLVCSDDCDILISLPNDIVDLKCQALAAMPSQTDALYRLFSKEFLCNAFSSEAFVLADKATS